MSLIKVTKETVILIILALISVIMLPLEYYDGYTCLELMEQAEFHGILLWIYYITFAVTILFTILQRTDFSKMTIIIHAIVMCVLLLMSIDYRDGAFWNEMGPALMISSICSIISLLITIKKYKK